MKKLASGKIVKGEDFLRGRVVESGPYFISFLQTSKEEVEVYRGYKLSEALEAVNAIFREKLREGYRPRDPDTNPFLSLNLDTSL